MLNQGKVYNTMHAFDAIRRNFRLLIRHVRFFRPWNAENSGKLKALEELFKVTNRFLRELDVEYWLVFGTLLGYYREGQIMRHDYDIDFGAHEGEYKKIWENRRRLPRGFSMYDTGYKHPGPKLYVSYKGWEADIYFYEDMSSRLRCYITSTVQGDLKSFPKDYVYPLTETTFMGENTLVPNQVEPYLVHMFGYIGENAWQDKETGYWHPKKSKKVK